MSSTTPVTLTTTTLIMIISARHLHLNHVNITSIVMNHHTAHNSVTLTTPSSFHLT